MNIVAINHRTMHRSRAVSTRMSISLRLTSLNLSRNQGTSDAHSVASYTRFKPDGETQNAIYKLP